MPRIVAFQRGENDGCRIERPTSTGQRRYHSAQIRQCHPAQRIVAVSENAHSDAGRGRKVFEARSCGSCHHLDGGGQRVGPDLRGAARRLGRKALLTEIILPDKLVTKRYYLTEYILRKARWSRAARSTLLVTPW